MNTKIFTADSAADLERCYPVMKELRPHLSWEEYLKIYQHSHQTDAYEIVGIEENGHVMAVMGYRILSDFVRGMHLYVDDLVSTEAARSKGHGARLLSFAETKAKELGLKSLRLCTGIENERGMKFYDENGWTRRAWAYTKKI